GHTRSGATAPSPTPTRAMAATIRTRTTPAHLEDTDPPSTSAPYLLDRVGGHPRRRVPALIHVTPTRSYEVIPLGRRGGSRTLSRPPTPDATAEPQRGGLRNVRFRPLTAQPQDRSEP